MPVVRREVSERTFFGKVVKWLFIAFNVFMLISLVAGLGNVSDMPVPRNEYEEGGRAVGVAIGVGALLTIWALGDIILGIAVLLTRRKKIIETVE